MKVLWFTNTPCGAITKLTGQSVIGGGWLYSLSEILKQQDNIELHIAFYYGSRISEFEYDGIVYHPVLRDGYDSRIGRYFYRLKQQFSNKLDAIEVDRLYSVFCKVAPDIVHFHGSEENFGLLAKKITCPMLLSIQGLLSPIYYKLYSGYQRYDVLRYESLSKKIICDGYKANERKFIRRMKREVEILKFVPNILGRTDWDRDCSLIFNEERHYYVCNEILRAEFMAHQWMPSRNNEVVALTTTISNGLYKGLEMVYKTSQLLKRASFRFCWNVIGIEEDDPYDLLTRKIIRIKPFEYNIHLLGKKNAKEIISILDKSSIYVQTSHIENSSNSLCEAMVLGMPIITSNAGGTSSMLQDGIEGVVIQDGDPYRLAGAIINMSHNYPSALLMGAEARKRALVRHDPKKVVKELLDAYYSIL